MTQQEVIKAFMKSLDKTSKKGTAALNAAIKAGAPFNGSPFNSFKELKAAMIRDCKNAGSADDFLKTYCGIDLSNKDTGAITGSDAGGSTTKTAESIVPEEGSLVMFNSGSWFNVNNDSNNLLVQLGTRTGSLKDNLDNVKARSFDDLSSQEKYLWRSIYTWWIENSLDLISESYGANFSFDKSKSSATNKNRTIYIVFENQGDNGTLAETWGGPVNKQKSTGNLVLCINMYYYGTASGKNGEVYNNEHLDRVIAHEMTHSVMRANIDYFDYLPSLIKEGMAELTHGIDDDRKDSIQKLANNASLLSKVLVSDTNNVKISGVNSPSYAGGYMFLRYLARQAGDLTIENKTANKTVLTFYGNDSIKNTAANVYIGSGAGNDVVDNDWDWDADRVTISGGSGNDTINNVGSYSTLEGGSGNDIVSSWSDHVKIYGDSGNDSIFNYRHYNGGYNVTIDGGTGNDSITSYGDSVSIAGGTGNDTIYNGSSASVGGAKVTINGGTGNDCLTNWGGTALIVGGTGNDIIWGDSDKDTLKGDAGNDKLHGEGGKDKIYGGAGNDSLWGGAGNDSLWGGDGKDTFIYTAGEGTDTIFDYEKGDMLKILKANGNNGSFTSSKYSGGTLTLAISGGGKVIFDDVSKSDKFNINGKSYKISGSKLK